MGFIASWLGAFASQAFVVALIKRILVAVGVSAVSYLGADVLVSQLDQQIGGYLGGVQADLLNVLNMCGFENAISVVMSAFLTRMTIKGLVAGGQLTKIYWSGANSLVLTP